MLFDRLLNKNPTKNLTNDISHSIFDQTFSHKLNSDVFLIFLLTERLTEKLLPMSPRTEQQFGEIREKRKKEILDTALELFANEGFYATSISKIAAKAGISKGLLYNYFDSKEDLIKTIIFNGIDHLTKFVDPNKDGLLTRQELKYFIEEMFSALRKEPYYWKLYFTLFIQPHVLALVEKRLWVMVHSYMMMLSEYFTRTGSEDPETEAIFFGVLLDGIGFQFMVDPERFPLEKVKNKLLKMYC